MHRKPPSALAGLLLSTCAGVVAAGEPVWFVLPTVNPTLASTFHAVAGPSLVQYDFEGMAGPVSSLVGGGVTADLKLLNPNGTVFSESLDLFDACCGIPGIAFNRTLINRNPSGQYMQHIQIDFQPMIGGLLFGILDDGPDDRFRIHVLDGDDVSWVSPDLHRPTSISPDGFLGAWTTRGIKRVIVEARGLSGPTTSNLAYEIDHLRFTPVIACYANCDGSTTSPVLNVNDFICFVNTFVVGCP